MKTVKENSPEPQGPRPLTNSELEQVAAGGSKPGGTTDGRGDPHP
jgi:hypothetical protein